MNLRCEPRFARPELAGHVRALSERAHAAGGRALLVGGSVRDGLLGQASEEADLEVYGLAPEVVERLAGELGAVHLVGRQFAVLHLSTPGGAIDISLPRRESKTGPGHKGFAVSADPHMSVREAARRRDFTVNALLQDPLTGEVLDPWNGLEDLRRGVLRHVSPAFAEDPLRVLRAARFVSRFGWSVHPDTVALCRSLDLAELPMERLEGEWRQILLRGRQPGAGLAALEELDALRFFPEVATLRGVPQDPEWHPEGDVFVHTCLSLDAGRALLEQMADPWAEMLGVLCHDLGKPLKTEFERGRWRSPEHDEAGVAPARSFLQRITRTDSLIQKVEAFVRDHLRPMQLYQAREQVSDAAIRRLALRVDIPALLRVSFADAAGRGVPMRFDEWEPGPWLLQRAAELNVRDEKPQPFLRGRDLLALGMPPGPAMGELLRAAFELQLEGSVASREQAVQWARARLSGR